MKQNQGWISVGNGSGLKSRQVIQQGIVYVLPIRFQDLLKTDQKKKKKKTCGGWKGRRNRGLRKFVYEYGVLVKSTTAVKQRTIALPFMVILSYFFTLQYILAAKLGQRSMSPHRGLNNPRKGKFSITSAIAVRARQTLAIVFTWG